MHPRAPCVHTHKEWKGMAQPVGLVVEPVVLANWQQRLEQLADGPGLSGLPVGVVIQAGKTHQGVTPSSGGCTSFSRWWWLPAVDLATLGGSVCRETQGHHWPAKSCRTRAMSSCLLKRSNGRGGGGLNPMPLENSCQGRLLELAVTLDPVLFAELFEGGDALLMEAALAKQRQR